MLGLYLSVVRKLVCIFHRFLYVHFNIKESYTLYLIKLCRKIYNQ